MQEKPTLAAVTTQVIRRNNKVVPIADVKTKEKQEIKDDGPHFDLRSYGPYRSSFYVIGNDYHSYEHLVLIAGGSGFGYFLSAITMISKYILNPLLSTLETLKGSFKNHIWNQVKQNAKLGDNEMVYKFSWVFEKSQKCFIGFLETI